MKFKVCGNTDLNVLSSLNELVDFVGLIFYKSSPRYVGENKALSDYCFSKTQSAKKVGIFVNESLENILQKVVEFNLDLVQLHGDESPAFCTQVRLKVPVIKAFRVGDEVDDLQHSLNYFQHSCDYFLFDKKSAGQYGGTGHSFDWSLLNQLPIEKPFFLGGGICHTDVEKILEFRHRHLFAIDMNSRFEDSPGVKNVELIQEFIKSFKNAENEKESMVR